MCMGCGVVARVAVVNVGVVVKVAVVTVGGS